MSNSIREFLVEQIAMETFGIETLDTRDSAHLDFHDLSVWSLKEALEAAYEAGRRAEFLCQVSYLSQNIH